MKANRLFFFLVLLAGTNLMSQDRLASSAPVRPQNSAATTPAPVESVEKKIEAYLRKIYAWGPSFQLKVGPLKDGPVPSLYEVAVEVSKGGQSDSAIFFVSKDGRYLFRGDMQDMSMDPLAATRARIRLPNNPSKGPADAAVVVVEYSDFQCPSCRVLSQTLRTIGPTYPQVRFVFKDFPLTQIHPWAMTAAIAGRCAYMQNGDAFWKLHDTIFENQTQITLENASDKMMELAGKVGLEPNALRSCMEGDAARQAILGNLKEGQELKINNTPTVFVNGRRLIGGDRALLEQYIQYELTPTSPGAPPGPGTSRPVNP